MDFILSFDWIDKHHPTEDFIKENELDQCTMFKIINNEFRDPLISSDSEEENERRVQNAKKTLKILERRQKNVCDPSKFKNYVPGLKTQPPFPKISSLKAGQHVQLLKVLAANDTTIDPTPFQSPTQNDKAEYEHIKSILETEQKEFINWTVGLWQTGLCMRMLKTSPVVEKLYECDFQINQSYIEKIPQNYEMCRSIPLSTPKQSYKLEMVKDMTEKVKCLQPIKLPHINKKYSIITNKTPEPKMCKMHPLSFILPGEKTATSLPLSIIHQKLANYAANNEVLCVMSSSALTTLVNQDQSWILPISVREAVWPNGDTHPIVIIDDELTPHKAPSHHRTKRAFELMLRYTLFRESQEAGLKTIDEDIDATLSDNEKKEVEDECNDSDEEKLIIDIGDTNNEEECKAPITRKRKLSATLNNPEANKKITKVIKDCTCAESQYAKPFVKTYRKWNLKPKPGSTGRTIPIIVHTSHKIARDDGKEVILNPLPQYIPEYGAVHMTKGEIVSKALDLHLRDNSTLLTARIDAATGDLMTFEWSSERKLEAQNNNSLIDTAANIIYSACNQLCDLIAGQYILHYTMERGINATLLQARAFNNNTPKVHFVSFAELKDTDVSDLESKMIQTPPNLTGAILPYHKHRKILPLAFTPHPNQVKTVFERKKPEVVKKKPPPRPNKRKRNNRQNKKK